MRRSGDGIVRKDLSMLRYWSPEDAQQQAQTQTGLLRAAFTCFAQVAFWSTRLAHCRWKRTNTFSWHC